MEQEFSGHLILLMAPSGSGKSVLLRYIRDQLPELHFAVSCTTRARRPGERDGDVYHFTDDGQFNELIEQGAFLEWAEYGGNRYGTLKSEILTPMREGKVVVREVELKGIRSISALIPKEKCTIVYIDAGSWEELKARILARDHMSEEQLALRYERYIEETNAKDVADIIIENKTGQLEAAKVAFLAAVAAIMDTVRITT